MQGKNSAVALRVGLVITVAVLVAISCFQTIACSSSASSGIVGLWRLNGDGGPETDEVFFNADGSVGLISTQGSITQCEENATYTFSGNTVTVTTHLDGGYSDTTTTNVSLAGNTLSVEAPDGGGVTAVYTRVNSNSSNSCP